MGYDTTFYIVGSVIAFLAVVTSFIGLRSQRFPGKFGPLVILVFLVLIGTATTFAVKNGQKEEQARAAEVDKANEEAEAGEEDSVGAQGKSEEEASNGSVESGGQKAPVSGPGGTLKLAASPTDLAFDKKTLSSSPGEVTIDFENPASLEHNVAIEQEGEIVAESETIASGKTSVTADLAPGTYTFLCTIPGHAEAGMEGTLTVR
jgi:plastocyanin